MAYKFSSPEKGGKGLLERARLTEPGFTVTSYSNAFITEPVFTKTNDLICVDGILVHV